MQIEPFEVAIPDAVLDDLRERIRRTRWPDPAPGEPWSQGTDLDYLRDLLAYWADGFDWRARERRSQPLRAPHRRGVGGVRLHFVHHHRAGNRLALVLTHGWPSTFVELLPLVDRLGDRFDLVVPSLPGYAFSPRPSAHRRRPRVRRRPVARAACRAWGTSATARTAATSAPASPPTWRCRSPTGSSGIHLSTPEMSPYFGPGRAAAVGRRNRRTSAHVARWDETERGYSAVQSTRPQTLGYGLNDSPAGLAAWVLDKWRSWSDSDGDLDARFGRDALLTMLTIWWATGSITSSMRDYYDNRWHGTTLGPDDRVRVPTAMAVFANEFVPEGEPPRSWYERLYQIRAVDRVPPRRALRRGRGTRPAGRRHRGVLRRAGLTRGRGRGRRRPPRARDPARRRRVPEDRRRPDAHRRRGRGDGAGADPDSGGPVAEAARARARRPPGTALGRLGEPSTASPAAWAAAGAAVRMLHDAPLPPWPGRSLDEIASQPRRRMRRGS